jgi:hypothetical protein
MAKKNEAPSQVVAPSNEPTGEGSDPTPQPEPSASVSSAPASTVAGIAGQLVSESPEPQENAIQQASDERAAKAAAETDSEGTPFDPATHTGTKTVSGAWRRKSGRKPNSGGANGGNASQSQSSRPKLNIPGGGQSGESAPDAKIVNARAGGVTAANLLIMLSVGIGGAEWLPRQPPVIPYDEKAALESAFGDYFAAKGWEDLPPGWALVAGIGMYAMPRFAMPRTQERAKGFRNWIANKYINWRANREKKKMARKFGPQPESDIERADRKSREAYAVERSAA